MRPHYPRNPAPPWGQLMVSMDSRASAATTEGLLGVCCFLSGNVDPSCPLGVLLHVIQIGWHDEVFWVVQASLVCVLLPAGVITLVGDVALTSTGLELPEVQPGLVVLQMTPEPMMLGLELEIDVSMIRPVTKKPKKNTEGPDIFQNVNGHRFIYKMKLSCFSVRELHRSKAAFVDRLRHCVVTRLTHF